MVRYLLLTDNITTTVTYPQSATTKCLKPNRTEPNQSNMSSNSKPSAACWALRLKKSDEPNDIFTNVAKVYFK